MDSTTENLVELAWLLVSRLERLSADSYWAHQASGLRGSLLRWLEQHAERLVQPSAQELENLSRLIETGFMLLEKAAREISVPETENSRLP